MKKAARIGMNAVRPILLQIQAKQTLTSLIILNIKGVMCYPQKNIRKSCSVTDTMEC